jgi:hypothetical protein
LANTLIDQLLEQPKRDWHALHKKLDEESRRLAQKERQEKLDKHRLGTKPSRELAAYVGEYEHPAYGVMRITHVRGALVWRWRDEEVTLMHDEDDTFLLAGELIPHAEITFSLDRDRAVIGFHITGNIQLDFGKMRGKDK